jgi:hypothetical protein
MKLSELTVQDRNALNGVNPLLCAGVIAEKEGRPLDVISVGSDIVTILRKLDVPELKKVSESASLCVKGNQTRDDHEAAEFYRRAFEVNPYNDVAIMSYGCLLGGMGRLAEGIGWVQKAISVNPLNERAKRNLATMQADL